MSVEEKQRKNQVIEGKEERYDREREESEEEERGREEIGRCGISDLFPEHQKENFD